MDKREPWWQRSVVYQIYPRSFCDSNGDGVGDLAGITSRLDHLQRLGVEIVWLSPIYRSPNDDNGYDVSDYRDINPEFGTMADFDRMLAAMHDRGLRLMMDLVVNHSSDDHEWFRQARSSRDNPYHDYYIWSEPVDGREPNNWESIFGGSAWTWNPATQEYYLHMFSARQPELNWENEQVRREVHDILRFWIDKGVDGFRMDVINMISKPWGPDGRLPDAPAQRPGFLQSAFMQVVNGPRMMEFLLEMKREVLAHHDCVTVGETPCATPEIARRVTDREQGALDMLFQFEHMDLDGGPDKGKWDVKPFNLASLKRVMSRWQDALADGGWNSLYLANHDQPRAVSRFADDGRYRVESARMLATFLHGMQGTPYVYQGEEIGMTNYPFERIEECRDIEILNMYREAVNERGQSPSAVMKAIRAKGRDNARTPMQWSAGPQAGFTTGTPWLAVNPNHVEINVESDARRPDSILEHYRRLIRLRRESAALVHGRYALLMPEHPQLYVYTRTLGDECLLVVCNFSAEDVDFIVPPQGGRQQAELLLGNWERADADVFSSCTLRAYEARLCRMR